MIAAGKDETFEFINILYIVCSLEHRLEGNCDTYSSVLRDTLCVSRNAVKCDTRAESFVSRFCSSCTRRRPMRVELHSLVDDAVLAKYVMEYA